MRWNLLGPIVLVVAACQSSAPPPSAEAACCACLGSSASPRGAPCYDVDAGACAADLAQGRALRTGPACLRDVCGEACGPLGFRPPARSTLEACCACLGSRQDLTGSPCFSAGVAACTDALDDGKELITSAECLETACGVECAFLARPARDGG